MLNYINHPTTLRMKDNVLEMRMAEGSAGYGVYVMLLEMMRDDESRHLRDNPRHLAWAINEPDTDLVERVIHKYGLFDNHESGHITSPWLEASMSKYDEARAKYVEAGKRGAARRYGKSEPQPQQSEQPQTPAPTSQPSAAETAGIVTPPIGGLYPPDAPPMAYTKYSSNTLNSLNQSKTGAEGVSDGEEWSASTLETIGRSRKALMYDQHKAEVEQIRDEDHNPSCILTYCATLGINEAGYSFLYTATEGGKVGHRVLVSFLAQATRMVKERTKPRNPTAYLLKCMYNELFES